MVAKEIILRTSERSAFKRCPAKWWWAYREGLKPRGIEKTPLWFGTLVHIALATWYQEGTKRGPHPAETFAKLVGDAIIAIKVNDADEETLAEFVDAKELGIAMLNGYVERYGRDEHLSFIATEQTFDLNVPWPGEDRQQLWVVEDGQIMLRYAGTFDGVYRDLGTGRIELIEHKTARAVMTSHLPLDDQAGSYWAVATHVLRQRGLIKPTESISGINYNFLRKAMPDNRPRDEEGYFTNKPIKQHYILALDGKDGWTAKELGKRKLDELADIAAAHHMLILGDRSKTQPTPLFQREMVFRTSAERTTQLRRIQDEGLHMMAVREGLLPITKSPRRECSFDCDFFTLCQLQEAGGDWKTHQEVAFRVMDPYADHRKSTDE